MSKQRFWYGVLIVILGTWSALELGNVYRFALNHGWVKPVVISRTEGDPDGLYSDLYKTPGSEPVVYQTKHWMVDGVYVAQGPFVEEDVDESEHFVLWRARERVGWPVRTAVMESSWSDSHDDEASAMALPEVGDSIPSMRVRGTPNPTLRVLPAIALHTALIALGVVAVRAHLRSRAGAKVEGDQESRHP